MDEDRSRATHGCQATQKRRPSMSAYSLTPRVFAAVRLRTAVAVHGAVRCIEGSCFRPCCPQTTEHCARIVIPVPAPCDWHGTCTLPARSKTPTSSLCGKAPASCERTRVPRHPLLPPSQRAAKNLPSLSFLLPSLAGTVSLCRTKPSACERAARYVSRLLLATRENQKGVMPWVQPDRVCPRPLRCWHGSW